MKKKLTILFMIMFIISAASYAITKWIQEDTKDTKDKIVIVTSFYPIYIATKNIVRDMEDVQVVCLTENQTGCLHDYQLTTKDMRTLEQADIFVMNGAGMEQFMEGIIINYPSLFVIDSSKGIPLLNGIKHNHKESKEENNTDKEENGHIWLNTNNYIKQIKTITTELAEHDTKHKRFYEQHATSYIKKVEEVQQEIEEEIPNFIGKKAIIFHDAFAYFAQQLGIEVVHAVSLDGETSFSAGEAAEIIDEIKEEQVRVLLIEQQYSRSIANSVSMETDATVYIMDSLVTGEDNLDSYLLGIRQNLNILREAFLYE